MTVDWQPIETAPKDGTLVDLWLVPKPTWLNWFLGVHECRGVDFKWRRGRWWHQAESWWDSGSLNTVREPTHWMLAPATTPQGYRR